MPTGARIVCIFLVNQHRSLRLNDWPAVQSHRLSPATNEGIQLFLAGSAGLLQITEISALSSARSDGAGRGAVSPENIAFTCWLTHLQNGVLLDEQNC